MRDKRDIQLDNKKVVVINETSLTNGQETINYTGFDGTSQSIVLLDSISDKSKRLSIHHKEWMRMYPEDV